MYWFWLALISAVFSALSAVYEKKALFSLDVVNFTFLISIITLLFSIPFFGMIDYENLITLSMLVLAVKTVLSAAAFLFVMYSIKNLEISEALPLLALTTGLVAVLGAILINDYLTVFEWLGIFLMITGTIILETGQNIRGNEKHSRGLRDYAGSFASLFRFSKYSYVIIALILFTITSLLDRILLTDLKLSPYKFMAFQQLFYAVIFTIAILIRYGGRLEPLKQIPLKMFYILIIISAATVIYRFTQIEATKAAPVALVLSVKRLSVLMAVIFGGMMFRERHLTRRIIAVLVILAGAAILLNL